MEVHPSMDPLKQFTTSLEVTAAVKFETDHSFCSCSELYFMYNWKYDIHDHRLAHLFCSSKPVIKLPAAKVKADNG